MTGFGTMNSNHVCCSTAAAGSSARNLPVLDTVSILAVSICILPLVQVVKEKQ